MTPEQLAAISGILLSLVFSYVPGLSDSWNKAAPTTKRGIMAALLFLTAAAIYIFSCAGITEYSQNVTCDRQGLLQLINIFIAALIANQAAYQISPKSPSL
ncbi:MAG: hypothetical protein HPY45_14810 [Anaerolineae bacterium]|nr:hypothetical protein [Anaerolineae bacterium]